MNPFIYKLRKLGASGYIEYFVVREDDTTEQLSQGAYTALNLTDRTDAQTAELAAMAEYTAFATTDAQYMSDFGWVVAEKIDNSQRYQMLCKKHKLVY